MIRILLLLVALIAGGNAALAWIFGDLFDAGICGAISAAAVLAAEGIAYCQRNRMRAGREQVWERRELERRQSSIRYWDADYNELFPTCHVEHLFEPRAVWPHEVGGFE